MVCELFATHRNYKKVYAIERDSRGSNRYCKEKYIQNSKKGKLYSGFAEEQISKLKLVKPAFFSTMCACTFRRWY